MALFGKRQVKAQVLSLSWRRVIQMDRQVWERTRSTVRPTGAVKDLERHVEQYWETVTHSHPGTADGTGATGSPTTTRRQVERTRSYFTYEELVWIKGRTLTAKGTDPSAVAWPEYTLEPNERISGREEAHEVIFAAGERTYAASPPEEEWRDLEPGASYVLTLGRMLDIIEKIAPARG